jgi:hypothetical protein
MKHSEAHWEWVWLSLIGLFLCLPLPLTIYARRPVPPAWMAWLQERNIDLGGMQLARPAVVSSLPNVLNGSYQREFASGFDREFIPRGVFIRLICELDFQLFRTTPLKKSTHVIVGNEGWLYERVYVWEYHHERAPQNRIAGLVKRIGNFYQHCQNRGIGMSFVLAPSKAAVFPEYIPPAWRKTYDERPRGYDFLMESLRPSGIPYVDGHALMMEAKDTSPAPIFPKGGTHWSGYGAWITNAALVETLRKQGKALSPLRYENIQVLDVPLGWNAVPKTLDADLFNLLNLIIPWHYPIAWPIIKRVPTNEDAKLTLAMVGGSFTGYLAEQLNASGQFAEINCYGYYKGTKTTYFAGGSKFYPAEWRKIASPVTSLDVEHEILAADCVILELNEELVNRQNHLTRLFDDAKLLVDRPWHPKPKFLYESYKEYTLGTDIRLILEDAAAITPYLSGFFWPEPTGTWTNGYEAAVRLIITPPDTDLVLDADALSFGGTEQYAEVFANETLVGKWRFPLPPPGHQRAVIPKEAIGKSGRLVLHFMIPEPRSMRQIGAQADDRPLGVAISRIRISTAQSEHEGYLKYTLGTDIWMKLENASTIMPYVDGFYSPEPTGTWTAGKEAIIRLVGLPQEADLVIDADALTFGDSPQYAEVFANKTLVGKWRFPTPGGHQKAVIPKEAIGADGRLVLRFAIPEPRSIRQLGGGPDDRQIALAFSRLRISAAEAQ